MLANWVTSLTNAKEGSLISSYSYTYYASGNRKSESDNTGKVTSYTYDGVGRLVSESKAGESITYTYDRFSNRASMTVSGSEGSEGYTTTYAYDANNRLTSETKDNVTTTYTYDNNGNTIGKATGTTLDVYSYNLYNQLTGNIIGGVNASYTYNAKGIRTSKTVGTDVTSFILDGGNVVAEVKGTAVTDYVRGINLICTDSEYYIYNAHGDVVSLTSTVGIVTKTYDYDAFGNEANPSDADPNPFRYCGEYYDTETGTYYLRARYYDPAVGRFTQQDLGINTNSKDPLSLNLYTYCWNNPLMFIDPSGHWPDWNKLVQGAILATVGVLTVAAVVATGGAATAVVALGYAAVATAGTTLAIQGTAEVVESITGKNAIRDYVGEKAYNIVQDISLIVASCGAEFVRANIALEAKNYNFYFDSWAKEGTKDNSYSQVMLGKFNRDGVSYDAVAQKNSATYFSLDRWDEIKGIIGDENMWYINKSFLEQQLDMGKEILLSHDPSKADGYFAKEIEYLIELGYSFIKDGNIWRAIK